MMPQKANLEANSTPGFRCYFPWVPLRPQTPTSLVGYPCRGYFSWEKPSTKSSGPVHPHCYYIILCISILPIVFQPQNLVFVKEMLESCLLRGILVEKIWSNSPLVTVLWSYEWYMLHSFTSHNFRFKFPHFLHPKIITEFRPFSGNSMHLGGV